MEILLAFKQISKPNFALILDGFDFLRDINW